MHVKNDHLQNLLLQFPNTFIEVPLRNFWFALYNRLGDKDSGRMILNDEGELVPQRVKKKTSGMQSKMNDDEENPVL
jgi:hypothetical protein